MNNPNYLFKGKKFVLKMNPICYVIFCDPITIFADRHEIKVENQK